MSSYFGIDISCFQRGIDLKVCKKQGVEFVIIRASYTNVNVNNFLDKNVNFKVGHL